MAQVYFRGQVLATPSALTALINGVEVFSGQVGSGDPLDTEITMFNEDTAGGSVTISVTSGVVKVGRACISGPFIDYATHSTQQYPTGTWVVYNGSYYVSKNNPPRETPPTDTNYWDPMTLEETFGPDDRSNILINGLDPEWPATPVVPMPGGTPENPVWTNWSFELGAGETITFNVTPE